jgi:tRNA threonylcarbamoyladenosine biosynthesis protein TsaB
MMRVLLIHTCGVEGSVALADTEADPAVVRSAVLPPRTFSEGLLPAVRETMAGAGWEVGDLGAVGVVTGPGSFTGVRTGLSVGKGLCEGLGIPLVGISRLALLAGEVGLVHAVLDAGREEFYYGRYRDGVKEREDLVGREELAAAVSEGGRVVACEGKVVEDLAGFSVEAVAEPAAGDALHLVLAGLRGGTDDVLGDANYLRRTDGEIFARPMVGRVAG